MSATPPITGTSEPKPEQVKEIVRLLEKNQQVHQDLALALTLIPQTDLAKILMAACRGWEQGGAGSFAIRVDKGPGRPASVSVQRSEQVMGIERRRP